MNITRTHWPVIILSAVGFIANIAYMIIWGIVGGQLDHLVPAFILIPAFAALMTWLEYRKAENKMPVEDAAIISTCGVIVVGIMLVFMPKTIEVITLMIFDLSTGGAAIWIYNSRQPKTA